MAYTLLISTTSPFARKVRMLMERIPHDSKVVNVFDTEDGIEINKLNPINQIPVLIDGETKIWDSRQIFNYLNLRHKLHDMNWDDENLITAIDGAMSSAVTLLLMKRSGMNTDEPFMFVNRQKERIESILDFLRPYIQTRALTEWNFITMSLYCFLDWATYRELINIDARPECLKLLKLYSDKEIVKNTDPRII